MPIFQQCIVFAVFTEDFLIILGTLQVSCSAPVALSVQCAPSCTLVVPHFCSNLRALNDGVSRYNLIGPTRCFLSLSEHIKLPRSRTQTSNTIPQAMCQHAPNVFTPRATHVYEYGRFGLFANRRQMRSSFARPANRAGNIRYSLDAMC
jgi:hypothetical protein